MSKKKGRHWSQGRGNFLSYYFRLIRLHRLIRNSGSANIAELINDVSPLLIYRQLAAFGGIEFGSREDILSTIMVIPKSYGYELRACVQ